MTALCKFPSPNVFCWKYELYKTTNRKYLSSERQNKDAEILCTFIYKKSRLKIKDYRCNITNMYHNI